MKMLFANVGLGSSTEMMQLKDIQNVIAKQNQHTIYITPRVFLETGASIGLTTWGRDSKNWLSRFLVYDLRNRTIPLLGYLIIDAGKVFRNYGCYLYKDIFGCTNPTKVKIKDIDKQVIKYSDCIPKDYDEKDLISDGTSCPFYEMCKHPLARYEHKKDTWIIKEMKGGLDERTTERYETSIKLLYKLSHIDEEGTIKLLARDGKQLKIKVNLYAPNITATKFTGTEIDELIVLLKGFTNLSFFKEVCENMDLDWKEKLKPIEGSEIILDNIKEEEDIEKS